MKTKTADEIMDGITEYANRKLNFLMTANSLKIASEKYDIRAILTRKGWTITEGYTSRYYDGECIELKYEGCDLDFSVPNITTDTFDRDGEHDVPCNYVPVKDK